MTAPALTAPTRTPEPKPAAASRSAPLLLQRKCACGGASGISGECEECQSKKLQRKAAHDQAPAAVPASVDQVLGSSGQPLDPETRSFFEARMGHDFSRVRVHADESAAASARDVGAIAYTVGNDVVFGASQYSPHSSSGRRLLAHELTHVVQQSQSGSLDLAGSEIGAVDTPAEREADAAEQALEQGREMPVDKRTPPALNRKPADPEEEREFAAKCNALLKAARRRAFSWLMYEVIPALLEYQKSQKAPPGLTAALARHFKISDPKSPDFERLVENLRRMRTIAADDTHFVCSTAEGCSGRDAQWVPPGKVMVCMPFVKRSNDDSRAATLIHELAHGFANVPPAGKGAGRGASDIAFLSHRLYSQLSTAQALRNADSYSAFVREYATQKVQEPADHRDVLSQCRVPPFPADTVARARRAALLAEQWSFDAVEALSGARLKSEVIAARDRLFPRSVAVPDLDEMILILAQFKGTYGNLRFECTTDCSPGHAPLDYSGGGVFSVCPEWFAMEECRRAEELFVQILLREGLRSPEKAKTSPTLKYLPPDEARAYARFARQMSRAPCGPMAADE